MEVARMLVRWLHLYCLGLSATGARISIRSQLNTSGRKLRRIGPVEEPWQLDTPYACMQKWKNSPFFWSSGQFINKFCLVNLDKALYAATEKRHFARDWRSCRSSKYKWKVKVCALKGEGPDTRVSYVSKVHVPANCFRVSNANHSFPVVEVAVDEQTCNAIIRGVSTRVQGNFRSAVTTTTTTVVEDDELGRNDAFGTIENFLDSARAPFLEDVVFQDELKRPCIAANKLPTTVTRIRGRAHICNDQENPVARTMTEQGWWGAKSVDLLQIGHTYIEMKLDSVGGRLHAVLPHCYDMGYITCLQRAKRREVKLLVEECREQGLSRYDCEEFTCKSEDNGIHYNDFVHAGCEPLLEPAIKFRNLKKCMSDVFQDSMSSMILRLRDAVENELRTCERQKDTALCSRLDAEAKRRFGHYWWEKEKQYVKWFDLVGWKGPIVDIQQPELSIMNLSSMDEGKRKLWKQTDDRVEPRTNDRLEVIESPILHPMQDWDAESQVLLENKIIQGLDGLIKLTVMADPSSSFDEWKSSVKDRLMRMKYNSLGDGKEPIVETLEGTTRRFISRCSARIGEIGTEAAYAFRSRGWNPQPSINPGKYTGRAQWMIWEACPQLFAEFLSVTGLAWLAIPGAVDRIGDCIDVRSVSALRCAPVMWSSLGYSPPVTSHPLSGGDVGNVTGDNGDCQSKVRGKRIDAKGQYTDAVVKDSVLLSPDRQGHLVHVRFAVEQVLPKFQARKLDFSDYFKPSWTALGGTPGSGGYWLSDEKRCGDSSISGICWLFTKCVTIAVQSALSILRPPPIVNDLRGGRM